MSDQLLQIPTEKAKKLTVIEFTAEETFLLGSVLGLTDIPLTTTSRRLIRPMFKLINQAKESYDKELQEISNDCMEEFKIKVDDRIISEPNPQAQQEINKRFSRFLKDSKELFKISFDLEDDINPLSVALKYFVTQVWVNIKVPPTIADGTLFDAIDEKFVEALPVLGKLVSQKNKPEPSGN